MLKDQSMKLINNNKLLLFVFFCVCFSSAIVAQEKQIKIKYPKGFFEHMNETKSRKNNKKQTQTTKSNQSVKLTKDSNSGTYDIHELTDELLKKSIKRDTDIIRPLLGISAFQGFYEGSHKKDERITADWRWLVPKDFLKNMPPPGRISAKNYMLVGVGPGALGKFGPQNNMRFGMMGGNVNFGTNCSIESLLQYVFWHKRKAKDHWSNYASIPDSVLKNITTDMPDSLVRLQMISASEIKSLVKGDDKKYKIIYIICEGDKKQSDNLKLIRSYVDNHKDRFCLVPLSDINNLSTAALCLKRSGYFEQAYVVNRSEGLVRVLCKMASWNNEKDGPSLFIVDDHNKVVDVETDKSFQLKCLESITPLK